MKNKPLFYEKQVLPGKVCKFSGQYQKEMLQKRVLQHLRCLQYYISKIDAQ